MLNNRKQHVLTVYIPPELRDRLEDEKNRRRKAGKPAKDYALTSLIVQALEKEYPHGP
jgi:hypothetical protein